MKTLRGFKVIAVGGLFLTASLGTLAVGGTASAVTPSSAVTCSYLKGNSGTDTATLKGCSAGTGGSGAITAFTPGGGDISWSDGTTTDYSSIANQGGTDCPSNAFELVIIGHVSSSTNGSVRVSSAIKMMVCVSETTSKLKNARGTVVKF
jgi:hypothetical protein